MSQAARTYTTRNHHVPVPTLTTDAIKDFRRPRQSARPDARERLAITPPDEVLVVDERWAIRPAQAVETKLTNMLSDASIPVSHLQLRGLLRNR